MDTAEQRLEAALARALDTGFMRDLEEQLARRSQLPSPKPNLELAREVGSMLASKGRKADQVVRALGDSDDEFRRVVAAFALASRLLAGVDAKSALPDLQILSEDSRKHVRTGVIEALRMLIAQRGEAMIRDLAPFMDGYLHAHIVLEALADRDLLTQIKDGTEVLARLDEAFTLADEAPRASDRSQGVRTLRRLLPAQLVVLSGRYPEVLEWLSKKAALQRPETREVVAECIAALRKGSLSNASADRLLATLTASAPLPRDPSRIVQGTRKRGRGR